MDKWLFMEFLPVVYSALFLYFLSLQKAAGDIVRKPNPCSTLHMALCHGMTFTILHYLLQMVNMMADGHLVTVTILQGSHVLILVHSEHLKYWRFRTAQVITPLLSLQRILNIL